jgi:hypothetical protein
MMRLTGPERELPHFDSDTLVGARLYRNAHHRWNTLAISYCSA